MMRQKQEKKEKTFGSWLPNSIIKHLHEKQKKKKQKKKKQRGPTVGKANISQQQIEKLKTGSQSPSICELTKQYKNNR